jgi:hypothetical protein
LGWLSDLRSDMPFVRLFPFDIIKPQSNDAIFFSRGWLNFAFPACSWQAVAFSAGGDGGRKAPEHPTHRSYAVWATANGGDGTTRSSAEQRSI